MRMRMRMSLPSAAFKCLLCSRLRLTYSLIPSPGHQAIRSLFSRTGQWPITCTFDYDFSCTSNFLKQVESYWKPILAKETNELNADPDADQRYILSMFPYPSGSLHLGHVRIYTSSDVIARYNGLAGRSVVHPMGWDSFGLPAENAAFQNNLNPLDWTYTNIEHMREQMESIGLKVNWREATSDPSYYKWTQWLFLQLFDHGLVYKSMGFVNWDPVDGTVLADDQVDEEGRSWRSGAKVEKRFLRQWFVKMSAFVDDIYKGDGLDQGIRGVDLKRVSNIQRAWIGVPDGYVFYLKYNDQDVVPIYTKQPELFLREDTFIAISKQHWLSCTGSDTISLMNPFSGNNISVSIFEGDQDLIPFATKATLMSPSSTNEWEDSDLRGRVFAKCAEDKSLGGYLTSKKYTDWLISRQRYWGTPIPVVYCDNCGIQPLQEKNLPVILPPVKDFGRLTAKREEGKDNAVKSKLCELAPDAWLHTECPNCKRPGAVRETDTCDTFFDSSWYYLRFATDANSKKPFDRDLIEKSPVWLYVGGAEHGQGHLLFARYMYHFLRGNNYLTTDNQEPFERMILQGLVTGKTYKIDGKYINPQEAQQLIKQKKVKKQDVVTSYEKMSKSKGNGVNPIELIEEYGCDATRYCVIGTGTPQGPRLWKGSKEEFKEVTTLLRKLILTVDQFIYLRQVRDEKPWCPVVKRFKIKTMEDKGQVERDLKDLWNQRNLAIKEVTINYEHTFRVGRSTKKLMTLLDMMRKKALVSDIAMSEEYEKCLADLIVMLSPIMPHITEELWAGFRAYANQVSSDRYDLGLRLAGQKWPQIESDYRIPVVIKVEGDFVEKIDVDRDLIQRADEDEIRALAEAFIAKNKMDCSIRKVVSFPGLKATVILSQNKEEAEEGTEKGEEYESDDEKTLKTVTNKGK